MGLGGGYGARMGHADTCRGSGRAVPLAQHAMNMRTGWKPTLALAFGWLCGQ